MKNISFLFIVYTIIFFSCGTDVKKNNQPNNVKDQINSAPASEIECNPQNVGNILEICFDKKINSVNASISEFNPVLKYQLKSVQFFNAQSPEFIIDINVWDFEGTNYDIEKAVLNYWTKMLSFSNGKIKKSLFNKDMTYRIDYEIGSQFKWFVCGNIVRRDSKFIIIGIQSPNSDDNWNKAVQILKSSKVL